MLLKLHHSLDPAELPTDLETISDEERQLFRKIGLSMKPFLCLGKLLFDIDDQDIVKKPVSIGSCLNENW